MQEMTIIEINGVKLEVDLRHAFEIVSDVDFNRLELNREDVLSKLDREIAKKEIELEEAQQRRAFFLSNFGRYFANADVAKA